MPDSSKILQSSFLISSFSSLKYLYILPQSINQKDHQLCLILIQIINRKTVNDFPQFNICSQSDIRYLIITEVFYVQEDLFKLPAGTVCQNQTTYSLLSYLFFFCLFIFVYEKFTCMVILRTFKCWCKRFKDNCFMMWLQVWPIFFLKFYEAYITNCAHSFLTSANVSARHFESIFEKSLI